MPRGCLNVGPLARRRWQRCSSLLPAASNHISFKKIAFGGDDDHDDVLRLCSLVSRPAFRHFPGIARKGRHGEAGVILDLLNLFEEYPRTSPPSNAGAIPDSRRLHFHRWQHWRKPRGTPEGSNLEGSPRSPTECAGLCRHSIRSATPGSVIRQRHYP
jgi:hypothetical protein